MMVRSEVAAFEEFVDESHPPQPIAAMGSRSNSAVSLGITDLSDQSAERHCNTT
jgi:hypothetical protein